MSSFMGHPSAILLVCLLCPMLCLPECHESRITICIISRLYFPHPKMFLRFISVATLLVIKTCVHTQCAHNVCCVEGAHAVPCMWRSGDSFDELFLPHLYVCPGARTQVTWLALQAPLPLSPLRGPLSRFPFSLSLRSIAPHG